MSDSTKYLIHVDVAANGVVERSDVVGAIFGQTEGLLGDDLNLHDLQQSSKVGRIDVEIESERGRSTGRITIASTMDKVETAVLGAALETVERIGPCRATLSVARIEDVRAATRRAVVDRAEELLSTAFDDTVMTSDELLEQVRERIRVEDIGDYEGYPAGPRVDDSDAIILVEGRADVLNLLRFGIKNAVAVEGTDVPDAVAELTRDRTATAFLDGDRGGELILKELEQVADIDAVAFAPPGRSVEELDREAVMTALRRKVPAEGDVEVSTPMEFATVEGDRPGAEGSADRSSPPATDDRRSVAAPVESASDGSRSIPRSTVVPQEPADPISAGRPTASTDETPRDVRVGGDHPSADDGPGGDAPPADAIDADGAGATLRDHVEAVIREGADGVRLLDSAFDVIDRGPVDESFELIAEADPVPHTIVLDDDLSQRVLDVCAQRGVAQVVARGRGEFTKQPLDVRIRTIDEFPVSETG